MRIESLQPYDDEYQVIDNGEVVYQGTQVDCMTYITVNTKEK